MVLIVLMVRGVGFGDIVADFGCFDSIDSLDLVSPSSYS